MKIPLVNMTQGSVFGADPEGDSQEENSLKLTPM